MNSVVEVLLDVLWASLRLSVEVERAADLAVRLLDVPFGADKRALPLLLHLDEGARRLRVEGEREL